MSSDSLNQKPTRWVVIPTSEMQVLMDSVKARSGLPTQGSVLAMSLVELERSFDGLAASKNGLPILERYLVSLDASNKEQRVLNDRLRVLISANQKIFQLFTVLHDSRTVKPAIDILDKPI